MKPARSIRTAFATLVVASLALGGQAHAQQKNLKANNLDQLLVAIEKDHRHELAEQKEREAEFVARKAEQEQMLQKQLQREQRLIARSTALERQYQENEKATMELQQTLDERIGGTKELFGRVREIAGETRSIIYNSLTSAQLGTREEFLEKLAQSKKLPAIEQLDQLYLEMLREAAASGKVARFAATIIDEEGHEQRQDVVRVGAFNAVSNGKYLVWDPERTALEELERQPEAEHLQRAEALENATAGYVPFGVDPSAGSILALLVQTPGMWEKVIVREEGGLIGWVIISIGILGLLIAVARLAYLGVIAAQVKLQMRSIQTPKRGNPLGRVIGAIAGASQLGTEALERKLEEAVLRETGRLEFLQWLVKVAAAVAPLLGLLGTVVGMIRTFGAITLFGTGDPKMMASGISEALVTTMLGLTVAIPLVLIHSFMSSTSRRIGDVLHEQAAGIVAMQAERERR